MKSKALYITSIFYLKIKEDLEQGIEIRNGIFLTNNKEFIKSLLTKHMYSAIGGLEFNSLINSDAIFYKISDDSINKSNSDELLLDFLGECKIIINDLWLIKDHSIDIMIGFVEYPYLNSRFIDIPGHFPRINSNWLNGGSVNSKGNYEYTIFDKAELENVQLLSKDNNVIPFSISQNQKSSIKEGTQRITRAFIFLQTARQHSDLGIKISHYCTAFECLFSTDTKELSHKLSLRIAYFLESEYEKRIEIFDDVKNIYSIRSMVVHGSIISKKNYNKLLEYSVKADNILRNILHIIQEKRQFDMYFRQDNHSEFELFLTKLTLGNNIID